MGWTDRSLKKCDASKKLGPGSSKSSPSENLGSSGRLKKIRSLIYPNKRGESATTTTRSGDSDTVTLVFTVYAKRDIVIRCPTTARFKDVLRVLCQRLRLDYGKFEILYYERVSHNILNLIDTIDLMSSIGDFFVQYKIKSEDSYRLAIEQFNVKIRKKVIMEMSITHLKIMCSNILIRFNQMQYLPQSDSIPALKLYSLIIRIFEGEFDPMVHHEFGIIYLIYYPRALPYSKENLIALRHFHSLMSKMDTRSSIMILMHNVYSIRVNNLPLEYINLLHEPIKSFLRGYLVDLKMIKSKRKIAKNKRLTGDFFLYIGNSSIRIYKLHRKEGKPNVCMKSPSEIDDIDFLYRQYESIDASEVSDLKNNRFKYSTPDKTIQFTLKNADLNSYTEKILHRIVAKRSTKTQPQFTLSNNLREPVGMKCVGRQLTLKNENRDANSPQSSFCDSIQCETNIMRYSLLD